MSPEKPTRPRRTRTLSNGRIVAITKNDGVRKRCTCARRRWSECPHPWHFSFKVRGGPHHRFPLDRYASIFGHPLQSKADAVSAAALVKRMIHQGTFPPAPAPAPAVAPTTPEDLTFAQFAERWRTNARRAVSENQQANDAGITARLGGLQLATGEQLGDKPIGLITVDDWEGALGQLSATLAASTFNKYRQAVLAMQVWAVEKGYLPRPWLTGRTLSKGGMVARRKGARRDRRLTPDVVNKAGKVVQQGEETRLMANASPWLQRLIVAALETGCRRGELLSLQWRDVSVARGQLMVRAENSKTDTMREVPISPRLAGVLALISDDPTGNPHPPTAFVFGDVTGAQVADPKTAWRAACRRAGVTELHLHDLRHEAASRLLERGWPLHHIQKLLGHQDASTTSIYLNATTQNLQDSMRRFGTGGEPCTNIAHGAEADLPPMCNEENADPAKPLIN